MCVSAVSNFLENHFAWKNDVIQGISQLSDYDAIGQVWATFGK